MASQNPHQNEAAAKMIGAQLQSLLKIPPIKKLPETDGQREGNGKERRGIGTKEPMSKPTAEKENSKGVGPGGKISEQGKGRGSVTPSTETPVVRDRFGRPFQSLDRRGRNKEFHNAPKRHGTNQRDAPPQEVRESQVEVPTASTHTQPSVSSKSRTNHVPSQYYRPTPDPHGRPGGTPHSTNLAEERVTERASKAQSYEPPPRFTSNEDTGRPKGRDMVDPALRLLARKPECPADLRNVVDHLQEGEGWPDVVAANPLHRHYINFLYRKNPKFPRARFYCSCCNYHLDTLTATLNHILQERHYNLEKINKITETIACIPKPSGEHSSYLTDLLNKVSKLHGMNHTERTQRLELGQRIADAIKANNLECTTAIFGSSLPGFGFRDANVNININVSCESPQSSTEGETPSSPKTPGIGGINYNAEFSGVTTKLLSIIKELPHISPQTVKEVYTPKCVSIHFEEARNKNSPLQCIVHFNNNSAVLVAQLFAEYDKIDPRVKPLVMAFRHLARVCDLDDQEKGFLPAHCYTIMVIYYLQNKFTGSPVLPILHLIPKVDTDRLFATAEEALKHWVAKCTETVGELWIGLLKFYALEFDWKTRIVSISRVGANIPKDEKQWNRKLCIEDPIIPKSNLSRSVTNNKICEYIIDRVKIAYKYFSIPRKAEGPLYEGVISPEHYDTSDEMKVFIEASKPTTSQALQRMVRQIQKVDDDLDSTVKDNEVRVLNVCWRDQVVGHVHSDDAKRFSNVLFMTQYLYQFKAEHFLDGSPPPIICKACGADGHFKMNCPEETVPVYSPVEYPTPLTMNRLARAIADNYEREVLDNNGVITRVQIVEEVRRILCTVSPNILLQLFGSTFNGFGMHSSDVDICLTFDNIVVPPEVRGIRMINVNDVLEKVVSALKASGIMVDILSIPSAKVPIVKFRHVKSKLDGDISLYNRLSIFNTELLYSYVNLDPRVAPLGIFLKKLVKLCDIGDASKGSLSSYSYILMLIYFLQNHTTPVLPVIQELDVPGMVNFECDNHQIRYSKDTSRIKQAWSGFGRNRETVGMLWLEFLNFYIEKFDHEKHVITITQSEPLTRASKCWYTDALAIEDPFDKTHNLGSGLTRRMSVHIIKTLQKCRAFFHRSTDHLRHEMSFTDYYLDARQVRDGNPPIDRQCRLCYRIGHFARNCTYMNKRDEDSHTPAPVERPASPKEVKMGTNGEVSRGKFDRNPIQMTRKDDILERFNLQLGGNLRPTAPPEMRPPVNNSPWGKEHAAREVSPPLVGIEDTSYRIENVIRKPDAIAPPKPVQDTSFISHSLNKLILRSRELEEAQNDANKGVKEVVFFGDIGGPNTDGEQIQAMLKKNEGVTFTFDLAQQQEMDGIHAQPKNLDQFANPGNQNNGMIMGQPPPGFFPGGPVYMGAGRAPGHPLPYIGDQAVTRPVLLNQPVHSFTASPIGMPLQAPTMHQKPAPISYGHVANPGIPIPFRPVLPIGSAPSFENRATVINGDNSDRSAQAGTATAPPPGFAPLPSSSSSGLPESGEVLRNYPASPYPPLPNAPAVYSMAPGGELDYQQIPRNIIYTSTPNSQPVSSEAVDAGVNYRSVDHVQGGPIGLVHHHQALYQPQMIPLNVGTHNGQQVENGEANPEHRIGVFSKINPAPGEVPYVMDPAVGGGLLPGGLMPSGNAPASSYGLSLSQAHHGPVVSALQMQHSLQMQGSHGHFHHHIQPILAIGNYHPGSPYAIHQPMQAPFPHGTGENNAIQSANPDPPLLNQNSQDLK